MTGKKFTTQSAKPRSEPSRISLLGLGVHPASLELAKMSVSKLLCTNPSMAKNLKLELFWSLPLADLFERLDTNSSGLTATEARRRLRVCGPNRLRASKRSDALALLAAQFKSPLILILLVAVGLSFFFNEPIDALIIIAIVLLSSVLGFWQEKRAADAVKSLLSIVKLDAKVVRDGVEISVPVDEVVPGDVCVLNAGDIIPGDAAILDSKDLFVEEAALTGESFPAEKEPGAALFLPFLPLLPKQIPLNNFLTDFPAMAIATDSVDLDQLKRPQVWDIKFIRNFMIVFGIVSSVFDFLTFGALVFRAQDRA